MVHKPKHCSFVFRWLFQYGTNRISPKLIRTRKLYCGSSGDPQGSAAWRPLLHIGTDDNKSKHRMYVIQNVMWPCKKVSSLDL